MSRDALSRLTYLAQHVSRGVATDLEFVNQLLVHLAKEPEAPILEACALVRESAISLLHAKLAEIRDNDYIVMPAAWTGNTSPEEMRAAAEFAAPEYRRVCHAIEAWLQGNASP